MAVGKLNRPLIQSPEEFIAKGGSSAVECNGSKCESDEIRMTFRCPNELIAKLDKMRKERPGRLSRNQAIIEILNASLK